MSPLRKQGAVGFSIIIMFAAAVFFIGCRQDEQSPHSPARATITIAAVGDVMMPASIQAAVSKNNYDYDMLFAKIREDLASANITFANLETPVDHTAPVSGYPTFNSRPALLAALKKSGVDVLSFANNHSMDAGVGGLTRTLDNIAAAGMVTIGAGKTKAEAGEVRLVAVNGITVGFLGYTYGVNQRLPGRKASQPGVNMLRTDMQGDLDIVLEKVRQSSQAADIVVVSLHWGDEYRHSPSKQQRKVADKLIAAGADIILGHHPHVLQPVDIFDDATGAKKVVAYSLGNFISSQNSGVEHRNKSSKKGYRGDGVILYVTVIKDALSGNTSVAGAEFFPLWTLREKINGVTIPQPVNLTRELARLEALPVRSQAEEQNIALFAYRLDRISERFTPAKE